MTTYFVLGDEYSAMNNRLLCPYGIFSIGSKQFIKEEARMSRNL